MRWLVWLLAGLLVLLQYKLWVGDGSLAEVWNLYQQVDAQQEENRQLRERNQALEAEVKDLKQGLEAIEERAREAGMQQLFVLSTRTSHWFRERGFQQVTVSRLPRRRRDLYNWRRNSKAFVKKV